MASEIGTSPKARIRAQGRAVASVIKRKSLHCTRRVHTGEAYRDGRWSGLDKDECGIHGVDGEGV